MKKILFIMVFILFAKTGIAQISFKIENITISNVIEEYAREDYDDSDYGRGPFITAYCSIINNNNDTILLLTSKSKTTINFKYNNTEYNIEPFPLSSPLFYKKDSIIILPCHTFKFEFNVFLFYYCDFFDKKYNTKKIDCTKEVIEILPILKIKYKDPNIEITTDEIKNVTVKNILQIYGN